MHGTKDVHFIYLGKSIPAYAIASLELAKRYSGLQVNLIGNASFFKRVKATGANFTAIEDFYDSAEFKEAAERIWFDHSFRDGFWLKTLERFFVLEQYIRVTNQESIFHAELDQLLFRADRLLTNLDNVDQRGLFLPFNNPDEAVASIFYCNSHPALTSLLSFASTHSYPNEMQLIAAWGNQNPEEIFALPTLASVLNETNSVNGPRINQIDQKVVGGLVDATAVGMWVAGVDPRNLSIREVPKNKYYWPYSEVLISQNHLSQVRFKLEPEGSLLLSKTQDYPELQFYNLHIHSKIHKALLIPKNDLKKFLTLLDESYLSPLPGARKSQIAAFTRNRLRSALLNPTKIPIYWRRKWNLEFKLRPVSRPFISGDTFRDYAHHFWEDGNKSIDPTKIQRNQSIFCQSDLAGELFENIISKINYPVVLLLGNSDENHDLNLEYLLDSKSNISAIYAQNLLSPVPGVEVLPIGLENAWRANYGRTFPFKFLRLKSKSKIFKIMWTFTVRNNPKERSAAAEALLNSSIAIRFMNLKPMKHRRTLNRYAFIASPPGNGLDCHRTWEAMYLRTVPIIKRSHMAERYEELGLPVWVVDSYDELIDVTEGQLLDKYEELKYKFDSPALWSGFWEERISYSQGTAELS